ncbi:MAG: hypothetical protein HQL02_14535, partial [Nitrospirae bacterium]|nr:hypothetical protein [Nitrospirota bacterium]
MIKMTKHAIMKINERNIDISDITKVVGNPDYTEIDKFDILIGFEFFRVLKLIGHK